MPSQTSSPTMGDTIQEVQGIFSSDAALQDAISRLTRAGFDRASLSLPAANPKPEDATPEAGAAAPYTEDDTRQSRTLQSSMAASVGAMVGAGVTVATGGAAAVAAVAALALGAASGGAVAAAHGAAHAAQTEQRNTAADAGELVLAATAHDADTADKAMTAAGALRVETVHRRHGSLQ